MLIRACCLASNTKNIIEKKVNQTISIPKHNPNNNLFFQRHKPHNSAKPKKSLFALKKSRKTYYFYKSNFNSAIFLTKQAIGRFCAVLNFNYSVC